MSDVELRDKITKLLLEMRNWDCRDVATAIMCLLEANEAVIGSGPRNPSIGVAASPTNLNTQ